MPQYRSKSIRKRRSIAGRAKNTEIHEWYAEAWDTNAEVRVWVKVDADDPDALMDSMGVAGNIADELFGEGRYGGPWHDN